MTRGKKNPASLAWIGEPLKPGAKLWRYVRLSSFLLCASRGHVFIPTLSRLCHGDPIEATMSCPDTRSFFDKLTNEDASWLRKKRLRGMSRSLFDVWKNELSHRRCIWCWHNAPIESMGLWHIYAKEGVAFCTTPARLARCVEASKGIKAAAIGRVIYHNRSRTLRSSESTRLRPYMIKQACYQYEKEVRIIFPVPKQPHLDGVILALDPVMLIERVAISPFMPESEAVAVKRLLRALLGHEIPVEISESRDVYAHRTRGIEESTLSVLEKLRYRAMVAKFGIESRIPSVMKVL
jgi:hypothetical protein